MDINSLLKVALPFIAAAVAYALQKDQLSQTANTTIASVVVLLTAVGDLFIQGKLTGNPYADFLLIGSTATALLMNEFLPLQQYLKSNFLSSPLKKNEPTVPQNTPMEPKS